MVESLSTNNSAAAFSAGALGVVLGAAAALDPLYGLVLVGMTLSAFALTASTTVWVAVTLLLAVLGRLPTAAGAPEAVAQAPAVFAFVALGLALLRRRSTDRLSNGLRLLLGTLLTLVVVAAAAGETGAVRPVLYALLLLSPFALITAIVLDPPTEAQRDKLVRVMVLLIAIQVPICLAQWSSVGIGDGVQGTFVGSSAGAHLAGAICAIGGVWLLLSGRLTAVRAIAIGATALVVLLTAANQVIFAVPVAAIAVVVVFRRNVVPTAVLTALVLATPFLAPGELGSYIQGSLSQGEDALKRQSAEAIGKAMLEDPVTAMFGQGPAETVSHSAFLTSDAAGDGTAIGGVRPAALPEQLQGDRTLGSVQSPKSSTLGLFGDLGIVGGLAYLALIGFIIARLRRIGTAMAQISVFSLVLLVTLGYLNDWLEQPPFTLFVAVLVGLALLQSGRTSELKPAR